MKRLPQGRYTLEFREEAVELVIQEGLTSGEASRRLALPKLSCEISTPTYPTTFTIQALLKISGISSPSTALSTRPNRPRWATLYFSSHD